MEEFTSKPSESSEENKEDDIILTNGSGDSGLFLPKSTQETGLISPDSISTPVALALSSALKKIEDYVPTEYVDFEEPDIDAINLNHAEQAIMKVTNLMNGAVDVINGLSSQVAQLYSNLAAVSEDDTDTIAWVKEKYRAMPDHSIRILYNYYHSEALYIFCKNTSNWGVVYRNARLSTNSVFQKLRISSGEFDTDWVESQYWALGEYAVTDIPKNADMHTYLTPGNYRVGSNENAATLKNCPLSKAFTMKVYYGAGYPTGRYGYIIQDYLAFDGSREVRCHYRTFDNGWITYEVGITKV